MKHKNGIFFRKGMIVMITNIYNKDLKRIRIRRTVGIIHHIDEDGYVSLYPLHGTARKVLRERYCEKDGLEYHTNGDKTYSDTYGHACHHVSLKTTRILGEV